MEIVSVNNAISQFLEAFFGVCRLAFNLLWNGVGSPFVFSFFALTVWRVFLVISIAIIIIRQLLR
jgi:hypothetical protein